jgi:hypothetical protein
MDSEIAKDAMELTIKAAEKFVGWIPAGKPRKIKQRGSWERRRGPRDRRVSSLERRLRIGFWTEFQRRVAIGDSESFELTNICRDDLSGSLVKEARRYEFSDRMSGALLEPSTIIDCAIDVVWSELGSRFKQDRKAAPIIRKITSYLVSKYNIRNIDRRQKQRRASACG